MEIINELRNKLIHHSGWSILLFILLAILFRFLSFFKWVIDHDESTYMVIAHQMLQGDIYWKDIIDTKPPGIFLVYGMIELIAGNSISVARLFVAIWIGINAWMLRDVLYQWTKNVRTSTFGGIVYIVALSLYTFYGISPNSELFVSGFSIIALWMIVRFSSQPLSYWISGLMLGIGISIKQTAAFDALAIGLFVLSKIKYENAALIKTVVKVFIMALMSTIPTLLIAFWYYRHGLLEDWLFHFIEIPGRYAEPFPFSKRVLYHADFLLKYFPFTILVGLFFKRTRTMYLDVYVFLITWCVLALISINIPGNPLGHYFIQIIPILALASALSFHISKCHDWKVFKPRYAIRLLLLLFVINGVFQYNDYVKHPHPSEIIYNTIVDLEAKRNNKDMKNITLYTADTPMQILYKKLNAKPPVLYPHPSLIWIEKHRTNYQTELSELLSKVYEKPPLYIVRDEENKSDAFMQFVSDYYTTIDTFSSSFVLHQRKKIPLSVQ